MEITRKTRHEVIRFTSAAYNQHIITKHMEIAALRWHTLDALATFGNC